MVAYCIEEISEGQSVQHQSALVCLQLAVCGEAWAQQQASSLGCGGDLAADAATAGSSVARATAVGVHTTRVAGAGVDVAEVTSVMMYVSG